MSAGGDEPGVARIKKEYLLKPREFKPKAKLENGDDKEPKDKNGENCDTKDDVVKIESSTGAEKRPGDDSPAAPKKKVKGQNKHRPVNKSARDPSVKLCHSVLRSRPCPMLETNVPCRYMHDIEAYLSAKPPDLGPVCYSFSAHGFCPQTLQCRFGDVHRAFDEENLKSGARFDDLAAKLRPSLNVLTKDLQTTLRKRKYDFGIADAAWKEMQTKGVPSPKEAAPPAPSSSSDPSPSERTSPLGSVGPERKKIDFADKLYLAPLTTCGNLPFRRICKELGADITCGEMAMSTNLLQGQSSEWALIRRHPSEDLFGVQLCGGFPDSMSRVCQVIKEQMNVDFVDINMGCPIDLVFKKGQGSALMNRQNKLEQIVRSMKQVLSSGDNPLPLTIKFRTGVMDGNNTAHTLIPKLKDWGVDLMTLHGRSREQRYTKQADWDYINQCALAADPIPFFGNGDVYSVQEYNEHRAATRVNGVMIARGALYKPWLFTEIKEQRDWDISSTERFELLRKYSNYGLEHWGSDTQGVETTRKFLLEWMSFLHRYIPVGVLERVPHRLNERAPPYVGRNDLETLMASPASSDWVALSEMLLGKVPDGFQFVPKHRANAVATWPSSGLSATLNLAVPELKS